MNTLDMIARWIEYINLKIGQLMGWFMLALVLLVTFDVTARYLFNFGAVIVQEGEWWLFSFIFLLCAGYTFLYDEHVRVDIVYAKLSRKRKNIVDLSCAFLFLFPMCLLLILTSLWYIKGSWLVGEISPDPGGMCCYWFLKSMIPFGFSLLLLQGMVNVYKKIKELMGAEPAPPREDSFVGRAKRMSQASE